MKIVLENIFKCLVTFWKCYFPPPSTQNRPPHNRKITKIPPPTPPQQQQKSKSHKNQNRTQREISLWVSGEVEGSGSKIGGSKALALGRRLWVRGVIWALGLPVKSKIGSWVHGFVARRLWVAGEVEGSWVAGDGLSLLPLSLSLFTRGHNLTLTLSLSVF